MPNARDERLLALLRESPEQGWQAFVQEYTPTLLALIERAGITNHDEAMDVYVRTCERLAERGCERLLRRDGTRGSLAAWLAVVVRNVTVDWVRTRAGRRRLFECIKRLDRRDQEVFELYYWQERSPSAIADALATGRGEPVSLTDVFDALERIERALSERQRAELVSWTMRARPMARFDAQTDDAPLDVASAEPDPERGLRVRRFDAALAAALARLPREDAAIVRLKFVQGLSNAEIERALRIERLTTARIEAIVASLRDALAVAREDAAVAMAHLSLLGGAS